MIHTTKTCETLLKPILKLSIPNKKLKILKTYRGPCGALWYGMY